MKKKYLSKTQHVGKQSKMKILAAFSSEANQKKREGF